MWAISECFRDKGLIIKRYINLSVYFTLLTLFIYMMLYIGLPLVSKLVTLNETVQHNVH